MRNFAFLSCSMCAVFTKKITRKVHYQLIYRSTKIQFDCLAVLGSLITIDSRLIILGVLPFMVLIFLNVSIFRELKKIQVSINLQSFSPLPSTKDIPWPERYITTQSQTIQHPTAQFTNKIVFRDFDKMWRRQKVTQNTFDKMWHRLPDAFGD